MSNAQFAKDISNKGRTTDEQQMASSLEHGRHQEDNNATTISKPRKQTESPNVLNLLDTDSESDEEMKQLQLELEKLKRQKKKEKKDMMKKSIERELLQYQQLLAEKQKFEKREFIHKNLIPNTDNHHYLQNDNFLFFSRVWDLKSQHQSYNVY